MNKSNPHDYKELTRKIEVTAEINNIIDDFIRNLGLKPFLREIIRTFVKISEGRCYFEASRKELAAGVYGNSVLYSADESKRKCEAIKYHLDNLLKWQEKNQLQIINIVTLGNRVKKSDGTFTYNKSKFHFVLLDEILKMIPDDSEGYELNYEKAVEILKEKYQPIERRKQYHPNHRIQKAGKTLITTLDNIFNLNVEAKSDPIRSCEYFLNKLNQRFEKLSSDWKEQHIKESIISEFERLMKKNSRCPEFTGEYNKSNELSIHS
jgi:hypothetical protein